MIRSLLAQAPAGPRIEIGVLRGATLAKIARHEGTTIGVDSFEGMPEPGEHDIVGGVSNYPKGRLAVGMGVVRAAVGPRVQLVQGFVPAVLTHVSDGPFAFAHLDIDHYGPTRDALEWLFARMMPGGILACDDWFDGQDYLAAKAINEAAARRPLTGTNGRLAWWVF